MYKVVLLALVMLGMLVLAIGCQEPGLSEEEIISLVKEELAVQIAGDKVRSTVEQQVTAQLSSLDVTVMEEVTKQLSSLDDVVSKKVTEELAGLKDIVNREVTNQMGGVVTSDVNSGHQTFHAASSPA